MEYGLNIIFLNRVGQDRSGIGDAASDDKGLRIDDLRDGRKASPQISAHDFHDLKGGGISLLRLVE